MGCHGWLYTELKHKNEISRSDPPFLSFLGSIMHAFLARFAIQYVYGFVGRVYLVLRL